ncbi:MAG: Glycosyltransferase [Promethearchaeota archaeon]|nr:MAG: Glycosyltransferase [Candidatus Lokiarchaeota archaeon]
MSDPAIIILIRNPILGKVKTRLAVDIGAEKTLKIYELLLNHTKYVVSEVICTRLLFYSDFIDDEDNWNEILFQKYLQKGGDLGMRMYNAFKIALRDHERALIIGSDCYELTSKILDDAIENLKNYDVVIGPAADGGYYLLGLKKLYPQLFKNKTWSTSTVFNDTMKDINDLKLCVYALPILSDIDNIYDLKRSKLNLKFMQNININK